MRISRTVWTWRALAAIGLVAVTGCTNWGPLTSTYNGQVRVSATGLASKNNSGGQNVINLTDPDKDGNPVYAHTDWFIFGPEPNCQLTGGSCAPDFHQVGQSKTPEIQNTSAQYTHTYDDLDRAGSQLRIVSLACAQMGWPVPDSCSNDAILTFNY